MQVGLFINYINESGWVEWADFGWLFVLSGLVGSFVRILVFLGDRVRGHRLGLAWVFAVKYAGLLGSAGFDLCGRLSVFNEFWVRSARFCFFWVGGSGGGAGAGMGVWVFFRG